MSRDRRLLSSTVLLVSLALALVGLSPASGSARAAAAGSGRITGTVTGSDGVPLEGVSVSAYPVDCSNGCDAYGGTTGADGGYVVEGLPPGAYVLLFQMGFSDYLPEYYDNVTEQDAATHVVVAAGGTVAGKDARLEHGGHLAGTVTGRGGRPLQGITVTVYRTERGKWQYVGQTSTARDGSYVAGGDGLLSGVYHLWFTDDSEPGYLAQYFGGVSTRKAARDIVVEEDASVAGLDAHLAWPRTLRVVKAPKVTGKPRAGATLRLFPGTWAPAKVHVEVLGWYADNLVQYLGTRSRTIKLVGGTLAQVRGKFLKVRFQVSAPGYIPVTKLLTVPGGPVSG